MNTNKTQIFSTSYWLTQKLQLPRHLELTLYDASERFDFTAFEVLLGQFKDFEHFNCTFYNTPTYQNQILCASSEDL